MEISKLWVSAFQLSALTTALALAGCGGGGGGNDTLAPSIDSGSSSTSTSLTNVNISDITLYDANGNSTRLISSNGTTAKVKVTDAKKKAISGALVTFSGTGVKFSTSNSSVITDQDGFATISISPATITDNGSYQISATASYNNVTATTKPYTLTVQSTNISLANMAVGSANLDSGGETKISLKTQNTLTKVNVNDVTVTFSASCGNFGGTPTQDIVSSGQGDVLATYTAIDANGKLCSGNQTITASSPSATTTQAVQLFVNAPVTPTVAADSILYTTQVTSANGQFQLAAKNSGSNVSKNIEFTVYAGNTPISNQQVRVTLKSAPSDFSFYSQGNTQSQILTSDASGKITVPLFAGNTLGTANLQASLVADSTKTVAASNIVVVAGRPSQDNFKITPDSSNVAAGGVAEITASVADRLGRAVPDGTVVNFTAGEGIIDGSCTTVSGLCNIKYTAPLSNPISSKVTILGYTDGDKAFTDENGDNQFTPGVDILTRNIGDFYRDDSWTNTWDNPDYPNKYRMSLHGTQACLLNNVAGNLNPGTTTEPNIPNTCTSQLATMLRSQIRLTIQ